MGLAQAGTIIRDGDNLKVQGVTPAGISVKGQTIWKTTSVVVNWNLLDYRQATGTNGSTTAMNTTGASLLMIGISSDIANAFTDSMSNSWTQIVSLGAAPTVQLFYCINPITSATHTFQIVGAGYPILIALAFQVNVPIAFDQSSTGSGTTLTVQLNPLAIPVNSLVVTIGGTNYTFTAIDSDFMIIQNQSSGGAMYAMASAYRIFAQADTIAPTWTKSNVYSSSIGMLSFKPV